MILKSESGAAVNRMDSDDFESVRETSRERNSVTISVSAAAAAADAATATSVPPAHVPFCSVSRTPLPLSFAVENGAVSKSNSGPRKRESGGSRNNGCSLSSEVGLSSSCDRNEAVDLSSAATVQTSHHANETAAIKMSGAGAAERAEVDEQETGTSATSTIGRILRPRNEIRNYAESPEHLLNGANMFPYGNYYESNLYLSNGLSGYEDGYFCKSNSKKRLKSSDVENSVSLNRIEGSLDDVDSDVSSSDTIYSPMPSPPPAVPLDPQKLEKIRLLRENLIVEETKLTLLKKIKISQKQKLQAQHLQQQLQQPRMQQQQQQQQQQVHHHAHKQQQLAPQSTSSVSSMRTNNENSGTFFPANLPSGLSITPALTKLPSSSNKQQSLNLMRNSMSISKSNSSLKGQSIVPGRSNVISSASHRNVNISIPQPPNRNKSTSFMTASKDLSPSVTITPAIPQPLAATSMLSSVSANAAASLSGQPQATHKDRSNSNNAREDVSQKQNAAKLALRKQLENTLLQIPPPKPPVPEMALIPNPSNAEFIYLLGLETVVDFLTEEISNTQAAAKKETPVFQCIQCRTDFTSVWKPEKPEKVKKPATHNSHNMFYHPRNFTTNKEHRVLCEQCVNNNIKIVLKNEHTNRLKAAFVKALHQEQEIEQKLAQNGIFSVPSPVSSPDDAAVHLPLSRRQSTNRNIPTPPSLHMAPQSMLVATSSVSAAAAAAAPAAAAASMSQTPSQMSVASAPQSSRHSSGQNSSSNKNSATAAAAAAASATAQALQFIQGLSTSDPAQLNLLSHLLYRYSPGLMASAASGATLPPLLPQTPLTRNMAGFQAPAHSKSSKSSQSLPQLNLADLQRLSDVHRQLLAEHLPGSSSSLPHLQNFTSTNHRL